ncbi:MAG: AAA family ATPase [Thermacetogeniaceae bacterium]
MNRKIVKLYDYRDEASNLHHQKVRYEPKSFAQRRPDGKGGWINNLEGIDPVLYKLPETIQANKDGKTIMYFEGEKDADNATALDLAATTSGSAEGWRDEFTKYFLGAKVVIFPDNDKPGRRHADQVARSLYGIAKSIKIINLSGLPEKGDFSDWLAAGGTKEELLQLVAETPEWEPQGLFDLLVICLSDVQSEEVSWLWEPYVPLGKLTLLEGDPQAGKTWVALAIAAAITNGRGCGR